MGDKQVALARKLGVDPGTVYLSMKIWIPPHQRVRDGKVQSVDGYWRRVNAFTDLTPIERRAVNKAGGPERSRPDPYDTPEATKDPRTITDRRTSQAKATVLDLKLQAAKRSGAKWSTSRGGISAKSKEGRSATIRFEDGKFQVRVVGTEGDSGYARGAIEEDAFSSPEEALAWAEKRMNRRKRKILAALDRAIDRGGSGGGGVRGAVVGRTPVFRSR